MAAIDGFGEDMWSYGYAHPRIIASSHFSAIGSYTPAAG